MYEENPVLWWRTFHKTANQVLLCSAYKQYYFNLKWKKKKNWDSSPNAICVCIWMCTLTYLWPHARRAGFRSRWEPTCADYVWIWLHTLTAERLSQSQSPHHTGLLQMKHEPSANFSTIWAFTSADQSITCLPWVFWRCLSGWWMLFQAQITKTEKYK